MTQDARNSLPMQADIQDDLRTAFRGAVRLALEGFLEEELEEMIGARWYERTAGRRDTRNGSYRRGLLTSLGQIEVRVPRGRESGSPGEESLGRYRRRTEEIDAAICEAYVGGVSTRGMERVTRALSGEGVQRSTVSRITRRLDEQVEGLRRAPIEGPVPYLYLDATFLDVRWARQVENVSALVAYGIDGEGKRRLLAITIGVQESEESWAELLRQLVDRGLSGVRLVISDAHAGLAGAVRRWLPEAEHQRCTVHLTRNVVAKVPQRLRKRVAREVVRILHAPSLSEARKRKAAFEGGLGAHVPEAAQCLAEGFSAATRYFSYPKEHWPRIRSTNGLERLHGEIKRRTRAVGAFPDRASALRLVTAVALQVTAVWSDRCYIDVSLLLHDNQEAQTA